MKNNQKNLSKEALESVVGGKNRDVWTLEQQKYLWNELENGKALDFIRMDKNRSSKTTLWYILSNFTPSEFLSLANSNGHKGASAAIRKGLGL